MYSVKILEGRGIRNIKLMLGVISCATDLALSSLHSMLCSVFGGYIYGRFGFGS